jgi:hypothetical protein
MQKARWPVIHTLRRGPTRTAALVFAGLTGVQLAYAQFPPKLRQPSTRCGVLAIDQENRVTFRGEPVKPEVRANANVSLGEPCALGNRDVVVVRDEG